jgi:oxygen-independent coproporphyrinogen-3 oxidase
MMITTPSAPHAGLATLEAPSRIDDHFGIYIHIPFCAHICPYCDFNTYANQASRIPEYVSAATREIALWRPMFAGRTAASIFIGGGTPSQLDPIQIGYLIAACRNEFAVATDAEVTIEANPNDLSDSYCAGLLEAGVNRLSIGAQTLDRRGLRVLGRLHEASQVGTAMAGARRAGFANLSLDLIYGWPGQTIERWRNDLEVILQGDIGGSRPDHLSLYGLIVEPGTPMADAVHRGILSPVDDDLSADFYELAIDMLHAAGWHHYEIANWSAKPDHASVHNAIYWRNGEYAGIGAGAHGHAGGKRIMNQPSPVRYIDAVLSGKSPATNAETIGWDTATSETMMLGLRLLEAGVSLDAFADRHGVPLMERFGAQVRKLESFGLLSADAKRIRLTARGALLANSVCAEFL